MATTTFGRTVGALLVLAAAACSDDSSGPRPGGSFPVVHAVLNPAASTTWILLEEALTGNVTPETGTTFDPREPIVTGGGQPLSGAMVILTGPRRSIQAREIAFFVPHPDSVLSGYVPDGRGQGVYFVLNRQRPPADIPGAPTPPDVMERVFPGESWTLEIGLPDGTRTVRGTTTVPLFSPLPGETFLELNRDRDSLVIELPGPAAELEAARYLIRIATPNGPMTFFTDSARVRLAGSLVNIDAPGAPRAFQPGFVQNVEIAAVDLNYFDYYRSNGNPRGGSLLLSHVQGAGGLFGAYTPLGTRSVNVTADQDDPGEGSFGRTTAPGDTLELYVDAGNRLTGQRRGGGALTRRGNLIGTLTGSQVALAFVSFQSVTDTIATFSGQLQGNAIVGKFSDETVESTFQRAP